MAHAEHGIRQIFVTLATRSQSILYTGSLRDATPLEGWTEPTQRLRIGRETEGKSFQPACNRLATCLQLACNFFACSGTAPALAGCCPGTDRGPRPHSSRERPRSYVVAAPPLVVVTVRAPSLQVELASEGAFLHDRPVNTASQDLPQHEDERETDPFAGCRRNAPSDPPLLRGGTLRLAGGQ